MYQPSSSHNLYQNGHYPYPHDDHSVKSNRLLHNYNWNRTLSQQMQPSLPSASPYYPSAMNKLNHDGTFRSIQPPPSLPTSSYIAQQQLASQPSLHSCMHGLSSNSMATGRADNIPQSLYYPGVVNYMNLEWMDYATRQGCSKRKGGQIRFSVNQTTDLEKKFETHKYLSPNERKLLAARVKLTEKQVKTWFQNRRAKWRRLKQKSPGEGNQESDNSDIEDKESLSDDDDDSKMSKY